MRRILTVIFTGLLFSNYFKPVHSLKLNIKSNELPLQINNFHALKKTFILLREEKQYDSMMSLLELETFDTKVAYMDSCSTMKASDYKRIMEHFYLKREMGKLDKILAPDCVILLGKEALNDSEISFSLRDLPKSLLSVERQKFCLRTKMLKHTYVRIVLHALEKRFTDIDWDNLVRTLPSLASSQEHLPLREAFNTVYIPSNFKTDIFYYLSPTMLRDCDFGDDIFWLIQTIMPNENTPIPPNVAKTTFIDPKILSTWTEQLFRQISALAFYYELFEIQNNKFLNRNLKPALKAKVEEAKVLVLKSLNLLNVQVGKLLELNPICEPFKKILLSISSIHSIFMTETFNSNAFINQTYKSIYKTFSERAPILVQGDWFFNLFLIFWKRKFRALKLDEIVESIKNYFSRNPTIKSISKVYSLYVSAFLYLSPNSSLSPIFELEIPENRYEEIYERFPYIFITKYSKISFEFRHKIHLISARKKLSDSKIGILRSPTIKELPKINKNHQKELIENFQLTVRSLNNFDSRLTNLNSYGSFKFIGNNFIKFIGIGQVLKQFFKLILDISDFRIILGTAQDGRPIIIVTPLITKDVGNILGQALAVSSILNIEIPFIIHNKQLEAIFKGKNEQKQTNSQLLKRIKKFCSKAGYLNLLSLDQERPSKFWKSLEKYFSLFLSWKNLFYKSKDLEIESENLIEETFEEFNTQIFSGFKLHFSTSKFSFEEIVKIIFKINL